MDKLRAHFITHFSEAKRQYWQPKTAIRQGSVSVGYADERHAVCKSKTGAEAERGL